MSVVDIESYTSTWILGSGKIGHEVHCHAIADALGVTPDYKAVSPRWLFEFLSPFGPMDFKDRPDRVGGLLNANLPKIAIAAGRVTVPYLRALKKASQGKTFTVFLQDPRVGLDAADVIWVPEHDELRGANVVTTLTSPHSLRPPQLAAARRYPDPRLAQLPTPRVALVLGGNSAHHRYRPDDIKKLRDIAGYIVRQIGGIMVTPSRRTPPELIEAIKQEIASFPSRSFLWDGKGDNPYLNILALADSVVVTGDSVNMVGEAVATGVPVHVVEPSGGHEKVTQFIDDVVALGAARRWKGALEHWYYTPVDATDKIAAFVADRYKKHRAALAQSRIGVSG
jgi:uncharacterized protein